MAVERAALPVALPRRAGVRVRARARMRTRGGRVAGGPGAGATGGGGAGGPAAPPLPRHPRRQPPARVLQRFEMFFLEMLVRVADPRPVPVAAHATFSILNRKKKKRRPVFQNALIC